MKNEIKRPWQGILLMVLYLLASIGIVWETVKILMADMLSFVVLQDIGMATQFLAGFPVKIVTSFVFVIALTLIVRGLIYGSSVIIRVVFFMTVFALLSGVVNLIITFLRLDFVNAMGQIIGVGVMTGIGFLIVKCLKHPFYGGDGGAVDLRSVEGWKNIFKKGKKQRMVTFE